MSPNTPKCLTAPPPGGNLRPALDAFDLAVRLEMEGVTDEVARVEFGSSSTFALARERLHTVIGGDYPVTKPPEKPRLAQFFNGVAFALPILICTITSLLYRISLWGGDLSADLATAVAIGTISSFLVTGGIIQASARRTLFQIQCEQWDEACTTCYHWTFLGVKGLLATLALGWALNQYFRWLPTPIDGVALAFHLFLGLLWLAGGTLYVLEMSWAVGAAVLAGIGVVASLHWGAGVSLLGAQLAGVAATAAIAFAVSGITMRRKRKQKGRGEHFSLRVAHKIGPYFLYGSCYYLFLFADRILAWTAQTTTASLPLQFRGDYETALDIAMIAFIVQAGWVHMSVLAFYRRMNTAQEGFNVRESVAFNAELRRFYWRRAVWFLPAASALGLATYSIAVHYGLLPTEGMRKVAGVAVASYPLLVFGLWNTSLFFALSRPEGALRSILASLVVNVIVGYACSRVGQYDSAVYGFAAGSAVFAILTTVTYLRLSRSLDYRHFASAA